MTWGAVRGSLHSWSGARRSGGRDLWLGLVVQGQAPLGGDSAFPSLWERQEGLEQVARGRVLPGLLYGEWAGATAVRRGKMLAAGWAESGSYSGWFCRQLEGSDVGQKKDA